MGLVLKDTLNKGHNAFNLSIILWSLQDYGKTILPLKEDNLWNYIKKQSVYYLKVSPYTVGLQANNQ